MRDLQKTQRQDYAKMKSDNNLRCIRKSYKIS